MHLSEGEPVFGDVKSATPRVYRKTGVYLPVVCCLCFALVTWSCSDDSANDGETETEDASGEVTPQFDAATVDSARLLMQRQPIREHTWRLR